MKKENDIPVLTTKEKNVLLSHFLTYPTLSLNLKLILNKYTRIRFGYTLFPEIVEIKKDPINSIKINEYERDLAILKEEEKLLESTIKVLDNLLKEMVEYRQKIEQDEAKDQAQFESELDSYINRDPDWK